MHNVPSSRCCNSGVALLWLLLVFVAQPTNARPLRAASSGHLYVGNLPYASFASEVARYPLTGGIPSNTPDQVYPNVQGPLWVDGGNHLYAVVYAPYGEASVIEFAPDATRPIRQIQLVLPHHFEYETPTVSGTAVDPAENVYVAVGPADDWIPPLKCAWQLPVFGRGAHGHIPPVQCLPAASPSSLAVDASGSLYEAASSIADDVVVVIAHAATRPNVARTLYGPSFQQPIAAALDGSGGLYVLNVGSGSAPQSYVAVYDMYADGPVAPQRVIRSNSGSWNGGIAVGPNDLYVATGSSVLVYDKRAKGTPKPLASLPFSSYGIRFVAVGP